MLEGDGDSLEMGGRLGCLRPARKGPEVGLECGGDRVADALPGDCACDWTTDAEADRSQRFRKERVGMGETSSDGARVIDVKTDGTRYLCMWDGQRQHVDEAFECAVAAGRGGNPNASHRDVGEHFVRRLRLVRDVLLPNRLVRCRGSGLDRDSPALRICSMETTRASLLWQAAAVRPEPEGTDAQFEVRGRLEELYRTCLGFSCFVILTNVAASRAWRDAPSTRRILSVAL